jgi:two-component system response regulator YesN
MFKALIVDDEPQIRKGLRTIISWEKYGFVVVGEAADGMDALEVAREQHPDLVITDVKMPRMGGMDLSRELRVELPETQVLVLSGYNEFAYAKEALQYGVTDYLLKPVDPGELGRSLERVYDHLWSSLQDRMKEKEKAGALKDFFLNKLIRGEIYQDPIQAALKYEIQLKASRYGVMIVSIDRYGEFLLSLAGDEIGWKRFAISNVIQELLPVNSYLFDISERQFGVLLCETMLFGEAQCTEIAGRIADSMNKYVKENVTIGIGQLVEEPANIRQSYVTAQKALEKKFYLDTERVFNYDQQDVVPSLLGMSWDDNGLFQAIREGSAERLRKETDLLLTPLEGRYVPLEKLKYSVMSTIIRLAKMTEEFHGEWQTFYTGKFNELENILEKGYIKQLIAFLYEISFRIIRHIETVNTKKIDSRVREMIDYIEQHYASDLNLKDLSKLLYINTVYLGQLFKKETGAYFNDYINKVRVGHASRLLAETTLSASDIAERVGYKYVDHFYRQFKLQFGMNPGEYRRNRL